MTVSYASRKTARAQLAALLATALVGTGKPAQKVYAYLPNVIKETPVVVVASHNTALRPQGMNSPANFNHFQLEVLICSLKDKQADGWSPSEAQDLHDDIEAVIRNVVSANRNTAYWMNMRFTGQNGNEFSNPSTIVPATIGGMEFDVETILVECEVNDTIT